MSDQNAAYGALVLAGVIALVMMGISGAWVIGCAAGIALPRPHLPDGKSGAHGRHPGGNTDVGETFTLLAALQFLA